MICRSERPLAIAVRQAQQHGAYRRRRELRSLPQKLKSLESSKTKKGPDSDIRPFFVCGSGQGSDQAGLGDLGLFVGVVRGTHQRSGRDVLEAHAVAFLGEPGEGIRMHETLYRQVVA